MKCNATIATLLVALCFLSSAYSQEFEHPEAVVEFLLNKGYVENEGRTFDVFAVLEKAYDEIFHAQYDIAGGVRSENLLTDAGIQYELVYAMARKGAPNLVAVVYLDLPERTRIFYKVNSMLQGEEIRVQTRDSHKDEYTILAFY